MNFALASHQLNGNVYVGSEFSEGTIRMIYNEISHCLSSILKISGNFINAKDEKLKVLSASSQSLGSLIDLKYSLLNYTKEMEKDGFALLAIDLLKKEEFYIALRDHNVYFIITNKPKNLTKQIKDIGTASVNIYTAKRGHKEIIPVFTTEKKTKAFISSLSVEDRKICKELKISITPLLETESLATIILNYQTEYERELRDEDLSRLKLLINR